MPDPRRKPGSRRTTAAVGVVALAVVLAGLGLVLAVRQTRVLSNQRVADARSEADRLVRELHAQVLQRVTDALFEAEAGYRRNRKAGRPDADPLDGQRRPTWLGAVFWCDGEQTRFWPGLPPPAPQEDHTLHRTQLSELVSGRLTPHLLLAKVIAPGREAVLLNDSIAGRPVLLAHRVVDADTEQPFVMAASLDLRRLRSSFLTPLLRRYSDRVRLVDAARPRTEWSQPLTPAMPFWALQPTPEFVAAQHAAVRRQTVIFVAINVMALAALLGVVWGLNQVVQRETVLSQLKSSFVADVSHELKTPLALIRLFGETLAEGRVKSEEKRREYYEIIKRESTRLTHLINNILDFSRIDAGRKEYKMGPVDVGEVVRSTYDSYRFDLEHNRFEHHLVVAEDLPTIHGDADAIAQALLNLMSNALKYHDEERYLRVTVQPETRRGRHGVLISVEDHGIGIRPEVRRHLFEGFYRATDERVRKRRGAGLGLAVVKHIVDAHAGGIDVESRLVKGSTFRVFLPARPPADGGPGSGPTEAGPGPQAPQK